MNYEVNVQETANNDVIKAVKYYEREQEGLGERFLNRWQHTLELLKKAPNSYQKKYKNFRQIIIKPFPYQIIYDLEHTTIIVYKVPYAGRHPRKRYTKK